MQYFHRLNHFLKGTLFNWSFLLKKSRILTCALFFYTLIAPPPPPNFHLSRAWALSNCLLQVCNLFDSVHAADDVESKLCNWSLALIKSVKPDLEDIDSLTATETLSLTVEAITGFRVQTMPEKNSVESMAEILQSIEKSFNIPQIMSPEGMHFELF